MSWFVASIRHQEGFSTAWTRRMQRMRAGSALVLDVDVADEDDEHADEGETEQDERGEDEKRHGPYLLRGW